MMQLFHLFWFFNILRKIINKTNCYATLRTSKGGIPRDVAWNLFTEVEFKAWLAIWLYMDIKQQPNMKSY